jgi:hypothetical protein
MTALKTTDQRQHLSVLSAALSRSGVPHLCELYGQLSRDFSKTQSDLTSTGSARVRRLDSRDECLLVRVKLACGSTEANGRI